MSSSKRTGKRLRIYLPKVSPEEYAEICEEINRLTGVGFFGIQWEPFATTREGRTIWKFEALGYPILVCEATEPLAREPGQARKSFRLET